MAYIFDLDQTIVDSSMAEEYRKKREWQTVFSLISQFHVYEEIYDIFEILHTKNEKICVVTSSPKNYCDSVLRHLGIKVNGTVCYHDTIRHKPYPDPILKAIDLLEEVPQNIVSIGDADNDVLASNAAGVISCLALWGRQKGKNSAFADYTFESVSDLKKFILHR